MTEVGRDDGCDSTCVDLLLSLLCVGGFIGVGSSEFVSSNLATKASSSSQSFCVALFGGCDGFCEIIADALCA